MMQTVDELERHFREATADFQGMQIRWKRVLWGFRWRMGVLVLSASLAVGGLTAALSGGLLAGKHAVDPSYRSLFAHHGATMSVGFGEPPTARGRTRLADYLADTGQSAEGLSSRQRNEVGFTFQLSSALGGYEGTNLLARWTVVDAKTGGDVPVAFHMSAIPLLPRSSQERVGLRFWVPYPPHEGRYAVRFQIIQAASGTPVVEKTSAPFVAYPPTKYADYRTPTYRAKIPRTWDVYSDYEPVQGRFVTRAKGPDGLTLVIDTTPKYRRAPGTGVVQLEATYQRDVLGYERLALRKSTVLSGGAFEWRYRIGDVWAVDVFVVRDGHGYAVLTEGPRAKLGVVRRVARAVAGSITPTG